MTHRLRQIATLLACRHDFDFTGIRDSLANLQTERKPSPSKRVPCPDCNGEGTIRRRNFPVPCQRCGGVEQPMDFAGPGVPGRGWIEVDDYTGKPVNTAVAPQPAPTRSVMCDGCGGSGIRVDVAGGMVIGGSLTRRCKYCEGTGKREVPLSQLAAFHPESTSRHERTGDPALDAAAAKARYSFAELDRALALLREKHPALYADLFVRYELGVRIQDGWQHHAALEWLSKHMPAELRVPRFDARANPTGERRPNGKGRWANRSEQDRRTLEIRRLYLEEQRALDYLAWRFQLTIRRVRQILEAAA